MVITFLQKCFAGADACLKPMIALHRSDSPEDILPCPSKRKTGLFSGSFGESSFPAKPGAFP